MAALGGMGNMRIEITENGPCRVTGDVPQSDQVIATDSQSQSARWRQGQEYETSGEYGQCRCGQSGNTPFCDGAHEQARSDGTEVATQAPYLAMPTSRTDRD